MFDYTDPQLEQFCTEHQRKVLDAYNKLGSQKAAAKELETTVSNVAGAMFKIQKKANKRLTKPHDVRIGDVIPVGYHIKGVSNMTVNSEGKPCWIKTKADDPIAAVERVLFEMCKSVAGLAPKIKTPRKNNSDLLSVYNIGDMHFGMHAWHKEVGVDFDLSIATRDMINSMSDLIARANNSSTAIILNLGDAIHFHDDTHSTKGHGNPLDADGRVDKVFGITCRVMNQIVEMALQKHQKVIVRNVRGNHDEELAMALRYQMDAYWRNEPRVSIEMSPADTWFYQFGKVMLMATHGHMLAPIKMIPYMSAREPVMWGNTILRRALHGHFHSKSVIESLGGKVEGFSNLAPNYAWHASKGYLSELECVMIEYHACGKEVGRQNYMLHQEEVGNSDNAGMLGKY
jgi:hypothetical protein